MAKQRLVFTSFKPDAGKTSIILGLAKTLKKKCGYAKPLGDRLFYRKKRLWDHDGALLTRVLDLDENPELITIGFDHSKLKYMYTEDSLNEKLNEIFVDIEKTADLLLIEGGKDFSYGASVGLSALSIAKNADAKLVFVLAGSADEICDDLTYIKNNVDQSLVAGVVINKIQDLEDFQNTHMEFVNTLGIQIYGLLEYIPELEELSMQQVNDMLLAKVIAGNDQLHNRVKHIDIGAMSINEVVKKNIFDTKNNLIITSGDRSDIILVAMDCNPTGIVLTNNILPPSHVIAKAEERKIPLLSVALDTYEAAKKIDNVETILYSTDVDKFNLLLSNSFWDEVSSKF